MKPRLFKKKSNAKENGEREKKKKKRKKKLNRKLNLIKTQSIYHRKR